MPPMDTLAAQTADDAAAARSAAQAAQRERGKNFGLNVIIWRSLVWFDWRKAGLVRRCAFRNVGVLCRSKLRNQGLMKTPDVCELWDERGSAVKLRCCFVVFVLEEG